MMAALLRGLKGSLIVELRCADVEGLLTACARRGTVFRRVELLGPGQMRLETGLEGYFILRSLCRRHMCRLRTVGKRGLPFRAARLGRRRGLVLGLMLAFCVLWHLSGSVWSIAIEGDSPMPRARMLALLDRAGVRLGARTADIAPRAARNEVLLMTDRLSYLAINLQGTHVQVVVRAMEPPPALVPQDVPCDVVSGMAGVIVALRVREGQAKVRVGETLSVGEVIASGTLISTQGEVRRVHASAEADLRTWYTLERRLPMAALRAISTGQSLERRAVTLGKWRIPLYLIETVPFPWYDKYVEEYSPSAHVQPPLPLDFEKQHIRELALAPAAVDSGQAARLLEAGLRRELALRHPEAQVLSLSFDMQEEAGAFVGRLKVECIETTGIEREPE